MCLFCTDPAVKESVYKQIFEFQSEDNTTQISIADQQSVSGTRSTVTDTVTEKVKASYIYYEWNCLIHAKKNPFKYLLG